MRDCMTLAPCPFCGGEAEMKISKHIPSGFDYTPRCKKTSCCGRLAKKYTTREAAVYSWNRRANVTVDAMLKRLFPLGVPRTREEMNYPINAGAVYRAIMGGVE